MVLPQDPLFEMEDLPQNSQNSKPSKKSKQRKILKQQRQGSFEFLQEDSQNTEDQAQNADILHSLSMLMFNRDEVPREVEVEDLGSRRHEIGEKSHTNLIEEEGQFGADQEYFQRPESSERSPVQSMRNGKATVASVRCSCNLNTCVASNYMCKSERRVDENGKELEAGCFVEELDPTSTPGSGAPESSQRGVFEWNGRVATARRGCIEMLPREKQENCKTDENGAIHCCTSDMCNYPKSFYPSNNLNGGVNINGGRIPSFDSGSGGFRRISSSTGSTMANLNLDQQVWLRAALIAVPICGLTILLVLILVARKLLKSDDEYKSCSARMKNSPRGQYYSPESQSGLQPVLVSPQYYPPSPNEYLLAKHCTCHSGGGGLPFNSNLSTTTPSSTDNSFPAGRTPKEEENPLNSSETEELVNEERRVNPCQGICRYHHRPPSTFNSFTDFEGESQHSGFFQPQPPAILLANGAELERLNNRLAPPKGKFSSILNKLGIGLDKGNRQSHV